MTRLAIIIIGVLAMVAVHAHAQSRLDVSTQAVQPGGSLTVTVSNSPGHVFDWITVAPVGSAANAYTGIWFLNGTSIPPAVGLTNARFLITVPTTAGTYEVRLLAQGYYERLATSAPITVGMAPPAFMVPRILFHGDSNTAELYAIGQANWTRQVAAGVGALEAINLAASGRRAAQVQAELATLIYAPDVAVIMVGTNDMAAAVIDGVSHADALGAYLRTIQQIIDTLRAAHIATVIVSPIFTLDAQETARFPDWISGLQTLCLLANVPFIDAWSHMKALAERQSKMQFDAYYRAPTIDRWHLSDAGHAMIAALVLSKIQR